jgi:hypothetical protein
VNDLDAYLANFWRATTLDPEAVAEYADWPVNETDLHARHQWLVDVPDFRERMLTDPHFYDPKIAGWWVWGISQWIGLGWCVHPEWRGRNNAARARGIHSKRPLVIKGGAGVHSDLESRVDVKRPQLPKGGHGVHRKIPDLKAAKGLFSERVAHSKPDISGSRGVFGRGTHAKYASSLADYFESLRDRLRRVRVLCGDWGRLLGPSPTTCIGLTAVFLDPPYNMEVAHADGDASQRNEKLYADHENDLSAKVREWALAHGSNPLLRIALCGYEGEHDFPADWDCVAWKANGGYANQRGETQGKINAGRERVWFSPHCLQPQYRLFPEFRPDVFLDTV